MFFATTVEIFKLLKKEENIEYEDVDPIVLICIKALKHSDYKLDYHF